MYDDLGTCYGRLDTSLEELDAQYKAYFLDRIAKYKSYFITYKNGLASIVETDSYSLFTNIEESIKFQELKRIRQLPLDIQNALKDFNDYEQEYNEYIKILINLDPKRTPCPDSILFRQLGSCNRSPSREYYNYVKTYEKYMENYIEFIRLISDKFIKLHEEEGEG
jgi:hypothetical protein